MAATHSLYRPPIEFRLETSASVLRTMLTALLGLALLLVPVVGVVSATRDDVAVSTGPVPSPEPLPAPTPPPAAPTPAPTLP